MDGSKPPAIVILVTRGQGKSSSIVKVAEAFLTEPGKEHKFIFVERRTNGKRKN